MASEARTVAASEPRAVETQRKQLRTAFSYLVGIGSTLLVLSPLWPGSADSFPVSTYPMFARPRSELTLHTLVAVSRAGDEQPIGPELVAGGEVLQAKVLIQNSVLAGVPAMAELCRRALSRVSELDPSAAIQRVEIVRQRYRPIDYFTGTRRPLERQVLYRCSPPSSASSTKEPR